MKELMLMLLAAFLVFSCDGKESAMPEWPWEDPEVVDPDANKATLDKWTDVSADYGTLPSYLKVYKSPAELQEKKAVAFVAVADLKQATWDIWSVKSDDTYATKDSYRTPSDVYKEGSWPVIVNGGYFYHSDGTNYTSSLAISNSEVLAYNINYASEDWKTIYYPTRAAFMELNDGKFDACWTYFRSDGHYMYAAPSDNSWSSKPAAQPSATEPEGAKEVSARTAIGGGPVLIDNARFVDSYKEELFDGTSGIGPDTNQPRTAIGVTADSRMVLFVCEGREMTEGVKGLTTADVARVLLDLGCVEAINLDGGGSSCMLVNGKETIKGSDGSQRYVASTVMIK